MTDGRFLKENALTEQRLNQIRQLNDLAVQRGQTLAQMALSWILRDGIVTSVLAGASKPEQILDNIKAAENTSFTAEELYRLMNGMSLREMDKITYPVCTLRRDHQRSGFADGVKVGMRLAQELL